MRTYGRIELRDGKWHIKAEPHILLKIKAIFGKVSKYSPDGTVTLSCSGENATDLLWLLQRYPLDVPDLALLQEGAAAHKEAIAHCEDLMGGAYTPKAFPLVKPARDYQARATEILLTKKRLFIGDDLGLGKSLIAISAMTDPRTLPALVVTLTALPKQWQGYIEEFVPGLTTHILKKGNPYELPRFFGRPPDVLICNYHKLAGWASVLAGKIKFVCFDEGQELRREGSYKYRAAKRIADEAEFCCSLSATPIFNYGGEFWNVADIVCPGTLGEKVEFEREWCTTTFGGNAKIRDPRAFGTYLRENFLMLRRTRKEVGRELPPVIRIPHTIDSDARELHKIQDSAGELARIILGRTQATREDRWNAGGQFDMLVRQATGLSKAPYAADFVRMLVENGEQVLLAGWHRACFGPGTPVLMYDGSLKNVEEVAVGDLVMGPDSHPRSVQSLIHSEGPRYRVIPTKGESWICSHNHILTLEYSRGHGEPSRLVDLTADAFYHKGGRARRNHLLCRAECVTFEKSAEVFEPWLMGYWLGNGASNLAQFRIISAEAEVEDEAKRIAVKYGLSLRRYDCTNSEMCFIYAFSGRMGNKGGNPIQSEFKRLGLHNNKRVPLKYKTASVESRRELLAGLIDSDGYVYPNRCGADYGSVRLDLAQDVAYIARSLGLAAYVRTEHKTKVDLGGAGILHRVTISGDLSAIPCRVKRKRVRLQDKRRQRKRVSRVGLSLVPIEPGPYFGFQVDGDHLFLLGDFTVVHNCYDIYQSKLKDLNPVWYTGSESATQKQKSQQMFMEGKSPIMFISLRAGIGVEGLQTKCHTLVVGELDWSPGVIEQLIGRLHRDGVDGNVVVYYLIAEDGADPIMSDVLGVKREQVEGIRNPDAPLIEKLEKDTDGIRKLAEAFLGKEKARVA